MTILDPPQRPKLAALAVVVHENRVLLIQRKNEPDAGLWGFPGGHVELGETAMMAAARELAEETGVIAKPVTYLTNIDLIHRSSAGKIAFHFLLAAVLCTYESGTPQPMDDALDARWVTFDAVTDGELGLSQDVAHLLHLARAYIKASEGT